MFIQIIQGLYKKKYQAKKYGVPPFFLRGVVPAFPFHTFALQARFMNPFSQLKRRKWIKMLHNL